MVTDYRAIQIRKKGCPEVLTLARKQLTSLADNKIRIKVNYIGIAFGDRMRRMGVLAPPWAFVPGYDVTGEIIAVGNQTDQTLLGKRVAAIMPSIGLGAYSEVIDLKPKYVMIIDSKIDEQMVLALGLNYITANHLLTKVYQVSPGDNIFIHGISGNVGLALAEFKNIFKFNLYGTCSAKNIALVEKLGATAFDYHQPDWKTSALKTCPGGYDLVLDGLGFHNLKLSKALLKQHGTLVFFGLTQDAAKGMFHVLSGLAVYLSLLISGTKLKFYTFGSMPKAWVTDCLVTWQENINGYTQGKLKPLLGNCYSFDDVIKAHVEMDQGSTQGKLTLTTQK